MISIGKADINGFLAEHKTVAELTQELIADEWVQTPNEVFIKWKLVNGIWIEGATQAEIDEITEKETNNLITQDLDTKESDGEKLFILLRNLIKNHHNLPDSDSESITDNQYKEIRIVLRPVLKFLKTGDWDIAQDNINNITPPINVNMLLLYNFIKNKIGTYVTNNY